MLVANREESRRLIEKFEKLQKEFHSNTDWTHDTCLKHRAGGTIVEAFEGQLLTDVVGLNNVVVDFQKSVSEYQAQVQRMSGREIKPERFDESGSDKLLIDVFDRVIGYGLGDKHATAGLIRGSFPMLPEKFQFNSTHEYVELARPLWSISCGLLAQLCSLAAYRQLALTSSANGKKGTAPENAKPGLVGRSQLVNSKSGEGYVGVSTSRLSKLIQNRGFPQPVETVGRKQFFSIPEVNEALRALGKTELPASFR